jgi:hypothetical protein
MAEEGSVKTVRTLRRVLIGLAVLPVFLLAVWVFTDLYNYFLRSQDVADTSCHGCHEVLEKKLVDQWRESVHFREGVMCETCHGEDHEEIFSVDGRVSAEVCGECHRPEYKDFHKSKHSHLVTGTPYTDRDLNKAYDVAGGCYLTHGCHYTQRRAEDNTVGSCMPCHPSHSASLRVSRSPRVCNKCHQGRDNPQWEVYKNSIHYAIWEVEGERGGGASCVTCHMPGGTHDDSQFINSGLMERQGLPELSFVRIVPREEFIRKRRALIHVCRDCHGTKIAKRSLETADHFLERGAIMVEEAKTIVEKLYRDELLRPMPEEREPNLLTGGTLAMAGRQIFDQHTSEIERRFYRMVMFDFPYLWRGAYHNLPELMLWHANEKMKGDLFFIRNEAYRLRNLAKLYEERGLPPKGSVPAKKEKSEPGGKSGGKGN